MKSQFIDTKIKSLIQICKDTKNYRKLTIVGYALISNILDETGIKLGLRPRDKGLGEKIFQYMQLINKILSDNLEISLYRDEMINLVKNIELQILKRDFNIPLLYIKELYNIYYDLRKLDIPNLHESLNGRAFSKVANIKFYSSFLSGKNAPDQNTTALRTLLLHKLKQKELSVQDELNNDFNKASFEKAIYLKKIRSSINSPRTKISVKGQLKDNMNYQKTVEDIVGYCFIGAFLLFFLLGFVIILEAIIYPDLTPALGVLMLIFFGPSALLLAIYWNFFHNEAIK